MSAFPPYLPLSLLVIDRVSLRLPISQLFVPLLRHFAAGAESLRARSFAQQSLCWS